MRFVLRQGTREVIFFSENRFIRFDGPETASNFLLDYLIQADNLARLREALRGHQAWSWIAMRDDGTVLDYVARLLSEGMLRLMADPEGLTPWTWQFRSPTYPVEAVQGAFEANSLVSEDDESEEQDAEVEDPVPEPVLPPTFIQVADMEAKGIEFLEKMYEMAMDLLRFVGLDGELPSELAPEYTQTALGQGNVINDLTGAFGASLDPLVVGGMDVVGTTQAGEQLVALSVSQGTGVLTMTEDMGDAIGDLAKGILDPPAPTEVGPLLLDEAVKHGVNLEEQTIETTETLLSLSEGGMPDIFPTELGPKLGEIALFQANLMGNVSTQLEAQIRAMGDRGVDPPNVPPVMPGELVNLSSSQMVAVMASTQATIDQFQQLVANSPPDREQISQICQQFQASTLDQVSSLTQGTDFVGGEIRGLLGITPPAHHDPSPIGDAFLSSVDDQTSGMLRVAHMAGESLVGLVGSRD